MFKEDTLRGHKILVTGGGSGLGLHMARGFSALGAEVVICGRHREKLEKAREGFTDPGKATCYECDVRDYDAVKEMFEREFDKAPLTGLVNNAAGNFLSPSEDLSPNGFKTIVDIVLHGTFNATHNFGKLLLERGIPGSVLNIVTTYTETGSAFVLPSACAKAGVYAMTTSLAYEWGSAGIRVNAIAPGPFPTEGAWKRLVPTPEYEAVFKKRVPMGRFGQPEELVNLASFLMSDMAQFINGECVTIDGGERLGGGQFNFVTQLMPRDKLKELMKSMRG